MYRTIGALGLLGVILTPGCFKQSGYINMDDAAVAKALPAGASIEDCLDLDIGDTADTALTGTEAWCPDADVDGYFGADASAPFDSGCVCLVAGELPDEYSEVFATSDVLEDCDDANGDINPGATEVADDGIDQDCDGTDLESDPDVDGDGFPASTDCDDTDGDINPGAFEVCDGIDNDCDSLIDDADDSIVDIVVWYVDDDADGFGDAGGAVVACDMPSGYVADDTDCDDMNGDINPGELEVCDGGDNDCDGYSDDADDSVVTLTGSESWPDADGDGFGDEDASSTWSCVVVEGQVGDGTDCDDADGGINPGAAEVADDGIDQDCDGTDLVTMSPTEVCITPVSPVDTCSLYMSDLGVYPHTPSDPGWYPMAYDVGVGALCADSPAIPGNDLKVNIECADALDGSIYWGWELVGMNVSAVTIGGSDVLGSVVSTEWDGDGDGDGDGADGVIVMP